MRGVRIVLRGLSDTFENLLPFSLASLGWWLAALTLVLGPGATVALYRVTDPRLASQLDRPGWRESFAVARRANRAGWSVALVALPLVAVLLVNLSSFRAGQGLGVLTPLWVVLLWLIGAATACTFALMALLGAGPLADLKRGALLVVAHLPRTLVVGVLTWLLVGVAGVLVVPFFTLAPALVASIASRFVLDTLGVPVADPLLPTDERRREEEIAASRSRFGP